MRRGQVSMPFWWRSDPGGSPGRAVDVAGSAWSTAGQGSPALGLAQGGALGSGS
jgi:hypothetical protein